MKDNTIRITTDLAARISDALLTSQRRAFNVAFDLELARLIIELSAAQHETRTPQTTTERFVQSAPDVTQLTLEEWRAIPAQCKNIDYAKGIVTRQIYGNLVEIIKE